LRARKKKLHAGGEKRASPSVYVTKRKEGAPKGLGSTMNVKKKAVLGKEKQCRAGGTGGIGKQLLPCRGGRETEKGSRTEAPITGERSEKLAEGGDFRGHTR